MQRHYKRLEVCARPEYRKRFSYQQRLESHKRLVYRRQRRARRLKGAFALLVATVVLLIGICGMWARIPEIPFLGALFGAGRTAAALERGISAQTAGFATSVSLDEITDTGFLALINGDFPIGFQPGLDLLTPVEARVPSVTGSESLQPVTLDAVSDLFDAARGAQVGALLVVSGYRGFVQQQQIYDDEPNKSLVQLPNHSEHQSGLAVDIAAEGVAQSKMSGSRAGKWLAANAWKYGLIMRYPADKQEVTGIAYEPWHFRYIGQPHAWYCQQHNLCFEEYIQLLQDTGGYQVALEDKTYTVLYQVPTDGILKVPANSGFDVSSDNTGGYIVTVWEQ